MENSTAITIAVITGILGPSIILFLKEFIAYRSRPKSSADRLSILVSRPWEGYIVHETDKNTEQIRYNIRFKFQSKRRNLIGSATYKHPSQNGEEVKIAIFHGYFDGRILKFDYEELDKANFRKGGVVLQLDDLGKSLEGRFVGYSPAFSKIVHGAVIILRTP